MIEYDKFQMSLGRLEEQHANYQNLDTSLPDLIQEAVAESVIQRFETCYDCLWKVLKRYLIEELGLAEVSNSPKPLFKLAHENDLFASPLDQWLQYAEGRIGTSHDYDGEKAKGLSRTHARLHRRRYRPLPDHERRNMGVDRAIDITAKQRKIVTDLLERHLPNTTAWVYGSRAKWASRPQSDLDFVVFATPKQNGRVSDLREALEESNLPFRVDLFVWDAVPEQFRKQIKSEHVVLVEKEQREVESGWREVTLDQLGRIVTGKTPPSSIQGAFGGDIPFVTPIDLDGRRMIASTARSLTEKGVKAVYNSRIPARSVMVSCIGSDMGKAAIAARECVTNQQINSIVVDSGDEPLFAYYNLSNRKAEIRAAAGGSAQPILNKSGFGQFDILLPPPNQQRAIAHILGTLDDKIELNRRMNETLEAMARVLFKSWFVDFDPVRAKMAGRNTGLPKHLANLFPDRLVDSELGKIPEGWEVKRIEDMAKRVAIRAVRIFD